MTVETFNANRNDIYKSLVAKAIDSIKPKMVGVGEFATLKITQGQVKAAKGLAMRRFNKMEKEAYANG